MKWRETSGNNALTALKWHETDELTLATPLSLHDDVALLVLSTYRPDYIKSVGGQFIGIRLKIAKKCCLYLDIFSCVKINVFRSFFAFRLEVHIRCFNQYKTGADGTAVLRQLMLFECMGICVLSPAHESKMRGYLVYLRFIRYLSYRFCLISATVY